MVKKLEHAVPMAKALVAGGVRVLEVTLRTECAVDAIRAIAKEVPGSDCGAGTVLNRQQLAEVTEAGAQFAISPGLTEPLLKAATEGTISDLRDQHCFRTDAGYGLRFERVQLSRLKLTAARKPRRSRVRFPGRSARRWYSPANYRDYLALKSVLCIGGSWLVPADALEAGDHPHY